MTKTTNRNLIDYFDLDEAARIVDLFQDKDVIQFINIIFLNIA